MVAGASAVTLALSLAACGGEVRHRDGDELVVASPAPNSLFTANEIVAHALGFYADEGVEVKVEALSDAIAGSALVCNGNGNADVGLVSARDALAAAAKTDGLTLPYDERTGGTGFISGIVVPQDGRVRRPADLVGRKIGLASPDQDLAFTAAALQEVGLTLDDVETIVVGPGGPSVAEALKSGRIDAFTGTVSDFAAFGGAGLPIENITPRGLDGLPVGGYIARTEDLRSGGDLVRFLRALAKGTYVLLERPEIAEILTREAAPDQWREP